MKATTSFRAVLGAAAVAAVATFAAPGASQAQTVDELLGEISQGCAGNYDSEGFSGEISRADHNAACGCLADTLGGRSMSMDQLKAISALFTQDAALDSMMSSMGDAELAGIDEALAVASESCEPGA